MSILELIGFVMFLSVLMVSYHIFHNPIFMTIFIVYILYLDNEAYSLNNLVIFNYVFFFFLSW